MANEILQSHCNLCGRITDHEVTWENRSGGQGQGLASLAHSVTYSLFCRGCKEPSIRKEHWFHDLVQSNVQPQPYKVEYDPPRLWRTTPEWLETLGEIDPSLKELLSEVYSAANDEQARLLSMGVRAVLDYVMGLILEGDYGSFDRKLEKMVEKGHLTNAQSTDLKTVIDAGSATAHRGFKPPRDLLEEMVVVVEMLIRRHYITGPMLKTVRTLIPPRPSSVVERSSSQNKEDLN